MHHFGFRDDDSYSKGSAVQRRRNRTETADIPEKKRVRVFVLAFSLARLNKEPSDLVQICDIE